MATIAEMATVTIGRKRYDSVKAARLRRTLAIRRALARITDALHELGTELAKAFSGVASAFGQAAVAMHQLAVTVNPPPGKLVPGQTMPLPLET